MHNQAYIYYNADQHGTSLGAFYAYTEVLLFMCKDNPKRLVTLAAIHLYTDNLPTAEPSGLLYDVSAMNISDQYNVFQGGNHPLITFT